MLKVLLLSEAANYNYYEEYLKVFIYVLELAAL